MLSYVSLSVSSDSSGSSFICEKCKLVSCLTERIIELEVCSWNLEKSRNSERSLDSQLEAPDASGRVSASSTPAAEPSQRGEWVASRRHRGKAKANAEAKAKANAEAKAKANAKAGPLEHRSSPVHVSNRFSLLGETPAEKPVERALVIGDSILRHVKIASPLGPPVAVSCIPGARAPDIRALNGLAPTYLTELISYYKPSRELRSQSAGSLLVPRINKVTSGSRAFSYKAPVLKELHWLPVSVRTDFKVLLLVYKALNNLEPAYITEPLSVYVPAHDLRSTDAGLLLIPSVKYKKHGETFRYGTVWNV
ncbi:hypothetical protein NFI96_030554 [Prochilodus magdalenae]|nr:hypothetical protein NFI96_030554 [Prochilodus magdalenae]